MYALATVACTCGGTQEVRKLEQEAQSLSEQVRNDLGDSWRDHGRAPTPCRCWDPRKRRSVELEVWTELTSRFDCAEQLLAHVRSRR